MQFCRRLQPIQEDTSLAKEKSQTPPLDQMLNDLESLVTDLEEGKLSLEQSMAAFTKGCNLVRQCQNVLNETEKAIKVLDEQMQSLRIVDSNELES
ncbi:exodeoxyribonuclease VII small subunit [Candidatus Ichthyocystis hellenicum]|uniref:exodeoxyribonuclease VII small subunit n=1 Tax=Candidatus Ichthyocystis hellenicum TaxID=1561003 RepID=UPI000B895544|nr:exodeoxyribonuclease VII small subunit [Candidatus Ichthyocystis hellenicum]